MTNCVLWLLTQISESNGQEGGKLMFSSSQPPVSSKNRERIAAATHSTLAAGAGLSDRSLPA
jgi:hypothetical protein